MVDIGILFWMYQVFKGNVKTKASIMQYNYTLNAYDFMMNLRLHVKSIYVFFFFFFMINEVAEPHRIIKE